MSWCWQTPLVNDNEYEIGKMVLGLGLVLVVLYIIDCKSGETIGNAASVHTISMQCNYQCTHIGGIAIGNWYFYLIY